MAQRSRLAALSILALVAAACESTAPMDAGVDAPIDAAMPEDVPDPPRDAPVCDASPAPADLPTLDGAIVVLSPDAGSPIPPLLGGDPVGVWRFETATIYSPPEVEGMIDAEASSIAGTAWVVVEGDALRMELALDVTLVTTIAGTIRRNQVTTLVGTYTVDGATLSVDVSCVDPVPASATGFAPGFSVEDDAGTLVLELPGMVGTNIIVLTGTRTAT